MFKRIDHVEIVPLDVERTYRFYTEVLGFGLKQRLPVPMPPLREVIYLQLGDTMLELVSLEAPQKGEAHPQRSGYQALALEVLDMNAAVAHLKHHGVPIHRQPVDLGDSWRGEILDPDGLVIELRQWK